jgi:putative endonuclease
VGENIFLRVGPPLSCHDPRVRSVSVRTGHPGGVCSLSKTYYVYILASKRNGTLYIGVTNELRRRVWEHKEGLIEGFTKKYGVKMLVYFETFGDIGLAIARETRLKKYKRAWKINLIQARNVEWEDLYEMLF